MFAFLKFDMFTIASVGCYTSFNAFHELVAATVAPLLFIFMVYIVYRMAIAAAFRRVQRNDHTCGNAPTGKKTPTAVIAFGQDSWMTQWSGQSILAAEWVDRGSNKAVDAMARRALAAGDLEDWTHLQHAPPRKLKAAKTYAFKAQAGLHSLAAQCSTIALVTLFMFFPSVSTRIFRMSACDSFEASEDQRRMCEARLGCDALDAEEEQSYCRDHCGSVRKLSLDYSVDCDTGPYPALYW